MSRTKLPRELPRVDFFPTPAWCVHRILEAVDLPGGRWLEPCVGGSAIVDAVDDVRGDVDWTTVDIRPETKADLVADFVTLGCPDLDAFAPEGGTWDVCITNPPYSLAMAFLVEARRRARITIFLLRLGWLSSMGRHAYLTNDMPDLYILPDRPSFSRANRHGSDSADYGWMAWDGDKDCVSTLGLLDTTPLAQRRKS